MIQRAEGQLGAAALGADGAGDEHVVVQLQARAAKQALKARKAVVSAVIGAGVGILSIGARPDEPARKHQRRIAHKLDAGIEHIQRLMLRAAHQQLHQQQ